MPKTVITYGTFDMFHIGHLRLFKRMRELGDRVIVGISTDEFNVQKGKKALISYDERRDIVQALRYVDLVIPESSWEQKAKNIRDYDIDLFVMGDDWAGRFDELKSLCEVRYLPRTGGISSTDLRELLGEVISDKREMSSLVDALNALKGGSGSVVAQFHVEKSG